MVKYRVRILFWFDDFVKKLWVIEDIDLTFFIKLTPWQVIHQDRMLFKYNEFLTCWGLSIAMQYSPNVSKLWYFIYLTFALFYLLSNNRTDILNRILNFSVTICLFKMGWFLILLFSLDIDIRRKSYIT